MSDGGAWLREGLDQDFVETCLSSFAKAMGEMSLDVGAFDIELVAKWAEFYSRWPGRRVVGFSDPADVAVKLLADSYAARLWVVSSEESPVIDLGSGNGWPGLAFASLGRVSLSDSRLGACDFMNGFIHHTALDNVDVVEGRAEEVGLRANYAGSFGIAASRAMASPAVAVEVASPFVRMGGAVLLWLGPAQESAVASHSAIPQLGLVLDALRRYVLPGGAGQRVLAVYRREGPCQQGFPRKMTSIRTKPLF